MLDPINTKTLQAARENVGLSRSELAERAGVDQSTIWRIENGKLDPAVDRVWSRIVTAIKSCGKPKKRTKAGVA